MMDLTCKWEHQNFFCRNFSSQRTYVSHSTALTVTQPRYKLRNFWPYDAACCANEYEKEKKNMITLAIYHGVLLATMGDYLQYNILLLQNKAPKVDLYSAVIFIAIFNSLHFTSVLLELVVCVNSSR